MGRRTWTTGEKFKLLSYTPKNAGNLAKELNRSPMSIQAMAKRLHVTRTYMMNDEKETCTTITFCKDCCEEIRKKCSRDNKAIKKCLEEAEIYTKHHKIEGLEEDEIKLIWKTKKPKSKKHLLSLPYKKKARKFVNQQLPLGY